MNRDRNSLLQAAAQRLRGSALTLAIMAMFAAFAWRGCMAAVNGRSFQAYTSLSPSAQEPSPGSPSKLVLETEPPTGNGTAAAPKFFIKGQVVNAITGAAVPNCHLSATPMSGRRTNRRFEPRGAQEVTAEADTDGRFEIAIPSAGGWSLTASARGYRTQAWDEHDGYSTAVILS